MTAPDFPSYYKTLELNESFCLLNIFKVINIYFFRIQQREILLRHDQIPQTGIVTLRENLRVGLDQRPAWPKRIRVFLYNLLLLEKGGGGGQADMIHLVN